jgi:penicillin-binding protein 1A
MVGPDASQETLGNSCQPDLRRRFFVKGLVLAPLLTALDGGRAEAGVESWFGFDFSDADALLFHNRRNGIRVLDRQGRFVGARGAYYGPPLPFEKIPPHVILLLVAQEDRRFFADSGLRIGGIDLAGIGRAIAVNVRNGRVSQGGSTLTQQVLKDVFLRDHGKWERKVEEFVLAPGLDASLTRAQIVFLYLNRVSFGSETYGIEAAARAFFDKPAQSLTLHEAAALIQALPAPNRWNIRRNPDIAGRRAQLLLDSAVALGEVPGLGAITAKAAAAAVKQPIKAVPGRQFHGGFYPERPHHGWYVGHAESESRIFDVATEGVRTIETFLDRDLQHMAHTVLANALAKQGARAGVDQGAVVAMRPNGQIVALVGGPDYTRSEWNNATRARRQPGSAFKLFVYLAALERGMRPADYVPDHGPIKLSSGQIVHNHDARYRGDITLAEALAHSSNVAAIMLIRRHVGQVIELARRLGITAELEQIEGLALGVKEVTLLEMVRAYATVANNGVLPAARSIARVRDDTARQAFHPEADRRKPVLKPEIARMMQEMLTGVVRRGTAAAANPGIWAAGKSGTTDLYRDAWFIGFTRGLVVGVWMGNERQQPMKGVTGGGLPAQVWRDIILFDARRRKSVS